MHRDPATDVVIALNLLYLIPGQVGGTETYAAGLLNGLAEIAPPERFIVMVNRESADWPLPASSQINRVVCEVNGASRARRYAFEQTRLPSLLRQYNVSLVHSLGYVSPFITSCPRVVTIPDVHFAAYGEQVQWLRRRVLSTFIRISGSRADAVLTLSQFSREQIERYLGIPQRQVVVTPLAGSPEVPAAIAHDWRPIDEPYLLAFGSRTPNKNLRRLIDAYAEARPAQRMVIVGHVPDDLTEHGAASGVLFTGYLDAHRMASTLRHADLLVFPSTYEGFGLPVLEAMLAGVPVLVSRAASLPEVAGDAACYFNPHDVRDMSTALREVASNADMRATLSVKGRVQAARFSWRRTATETLALYRRVIQSAHHAS